MSGKAPKRPPASRLRPMPVRFGEDLQIPNANALEQYLAGNFPTADVRKKPRFDWKFRWKNKRYGDPVRFGDWVQLETGSGWLLYLADLNDMEPGHSGGDLVKMVHQDQSRSHNTHWRLYSPSKRNGAVMRHGDLFYLRSLLREEDYLSIAPPTDRKDKPRTLAGVRTNVKEKDHKAGLWRAEPIKTDLTEATDKAISYAQKNSRTEVLKDVLLVEFSSFMGAKEANAEKAAAMIQEAVRGTTAKPITRAEDYDRRKILKAFREMMRPDPGLAVNKSYYANNLATLGATPAERQAFLDAIDASFTNQISDAELDELIQPRRTPPHTEREQIAVPPAETMPLWLDVAIGILAFNTPFTGVLLNVMRGVAAATGFTFAMGAEAGAGAGVAGAFQGGVCTYPDGRLGSTALQRPRWG